MAPKHGLGALQAEEQHAKRAKNSETPGSRSATPVDLQGKVPFEVKYPPRNTKRKLTKKEQELVDNAEHMVSPFIAQGATKAGELDQDYTIVPWEEWDSMKKYNNFIIQGELYRNNQFVYVRGETTPRDNKAVEDPKDFWVARILQVRAKNTQHVYALVAWMYWPDELPAPKKPALDQVNARSGKRTYHGSYELVASNHMEVLDVLSFAGKAEVAHWLEEDDALQQQLYWRQTFCRETQELSNIREHCVCGNHFNPEIPMEICENSSCKVWLHEECIIDDALSKTYKRLVEDDSSVEQDSKTTNGAASKTNGKKSKTRGKMWKGKLKGKLVPARDKEATTITITDLRPDGVGTWSERIPCPKCGTLLE